MFRRAFTPTSFTSGQGGFVGNLLGALTDTLIQIFAIFLVAAGIAPFIRGEVSVGQLLLLLGGLLLTTLPISRITRTKYTIDIWQWGLVEVNTLSVLYFLSDIPWLVFGVSWLYDSLTAAPDPKIEQDPAFSIGGPATVLAIAGALFALRLWTRLRDR